MDYLGYKEIGDLTGREAGLRIGALASRYRAWLAETCNAALLPVFWERNPFEFTEMLRVSPQLQIPPVGTVDGHNTVLNSTIMDSMRVDQAVPVSPLFVRDLCGRTVYIGYGPEVKGNAEWAQYKAKAGPDGKVSEDDFNALVPLVTFPRFCHDIEAMEGGELIENVFLTKFRCLEMSVGFNAMLSGAEEDDLVAASYTGANLYPYKLRLDTFYTDGWKLPQTQMVFAKREGINQYAAVEAGEEILRKWRSRDAGQSYGDWLEAMGGAEQVERWYHRGCTLIPTFEACNGYNVVGPNFELEDYWPGRAVPGLHRIVETRADKSPRGTILQVMNPGFVTHTTVEQAQVIVSDGSGYVSVHDQQSLPLIPNVALPHSRTIADWQSVWLPTQPLHFEVPALWGWDVDTGHFMQLSGPLWDPLHYYYASVDEVLKAYETPLSYEENRWFVPVPEHMKARFYPIVEMRGFDTLSEATFNKRVAAGVLPRSCIKRVETGEVSAGIGYHPMPAEFEFEIEPFWFPEFHPLNRDYGICPDGLLGLIADIITPNVTAAAYIATVDGPEDAEWLTDETKLFTPEPDALRNYPDLARYLVPDMELADILKLCPVPFLSDVGDLIARPAKDWWRNEGGIPLDSEADLEALHPGIGETIWDARELAVELAKFRHLMYQTNLPLYMIGWWSGASVDDLQEMMENWVSSGGGEGVAGAPSEAEQQQKALETMRGTRQAATPVMQAMPEEKF